MICWILCFATLIAFVHSSEAQLSTKEVLQNVTQCNLKKDISLNCGTDAVIAVHSLQYAYNVSCEPTCCPYSNTDCFVYAEANDIKELRRTCSGQKSCNVSISTDKTDFTTCSLGVKEISYVFVQYYCIAEARIQSICSHGEILSSANNPVYLTNEGYPAVTTGAMSCSCSVELFSCNSNINLYISDADLYSDTVNCQQSITFNDPDNQMLTTIGCEDHYGNQLETVLLDSHYVKIDFTSNSTENLEGYFFVGFDTTVSDVSFKLTCSSQPETWCAGCGTVPIINNGNVTLNKEDDVSFEATANVTCDSGYETDTSNITCQANGTWSSTECTAKRCGTVPTINNGNVTLNKEDDDSFGATANVTCDSGYETGTPIISCQANATWPTPECTEKRCGTVPTINNGNVKLNKENDDSLGATANVTCDSGYETGTSIITCQANGTWPIPECTEKRCGTVPTINNGDVKLNKENDDTFGATANVTCDSGYETDTFTITCQANGTWPIPECTEKRCGTVPTVNNGNVILNKENNDSLGATANVTCDSGYETGTPIITCQTNGTWPTPECTEKPACSVDQWRCDNGDCISKDSICDNLPDCIDESDERSCSAQICPEGMKACPHSNGSSVCVNDGISCDCGSIPSIDNGNISLNGNSTIGAVADVTCNEGYNPNNPSVTCLETGSWEIASCSPEDCGSLPSISFGRYQLVDASSTVFGATAKVVCDPGYTSKTINITCQSSGQWESAVCSKERCGTVPTVNNGNVILNKENNDSLGATANVTCDSGYETGTPIITCQTNGTWPTPECTEKPACSVDQWRCDNGDCISKDSICDNLPDCIDESDERSCSAQICPEGMKACPHSNGSSVCVNDGISCAKQPPSPTDKKDSGIDIIIIVVVVILIVLLIFQLLFMCFLQCRIYNIRETAAKGNSDIHNRILITLLGSIPIVGCIPIYLTWKVFYRDVYKVNQKKKEDKNNKSGNSNNTNISNYVQGRKTHEFSELRDIQAANK